MRTDPEVDAWFARYENPLKDSMLAVRLVVLSADPRVTECIKWSSPTFVFKGNMASFNPRSKKHVSLLFHTGAQIPGTHPRLEGGAGTARYMKFGGPEDVKAAVSEIEAVVRAWCKFREG